MKCHEKVFIKTLCSLEKQVTYNEIIIHSEFYISDIIRSSLKDNCTRYD